MAGEELFEGLRRLIEAGAYPHGSRLPSERLIARQFETSRAAVREAIARLTQIDLVEQKPNCRPRVRYLVAKAEPEQTKRGTRVAVWMLPDLQDVGTTLILQGVRRVVGSAGRQLLVSCPQSGDRDVVHRSAEDFFRSSLEDPSIEGLVVWPSADEALVPYYRECVARGVPLVFVDREPPTWTEADVVAVDHFRGARAATRHLLDLGHRRIGLVVNDDRVSSVRDRVDGYVAALGEARVPLDPDLQVEVTFLYGDGFAASVEAAVDRLFSLDAPPTAIFAVNDQIAMAIQDVLARRGVRVPGDVSLVGFDWFLRWLPSGGALTTVAQPFEEIGRAAARRLFERLEGSEPSPPCHVFLPAPVVVKSTTAPLSSGDVAVYYPPETGL